MMNFYSKVFVSFGLLSILSGSFAACAIDTANPVAIDSRIKTLVYSENEVFTVILNYGYHSYIEFAKGESIKVMAMGDSVNWKVKSVGNKLFIMPLEKRGKTNMIVETNRGRSYAFDLICRSDPELQETEELALNADYSVARDLAYIVRFYYPKTEEEFDLDGVKLPDLSPPSQIQKLATAQLSPLIAPNSTKNHYDYIARDGSSDIVPIELFDDGKLTYFKFPQNNRVIPKIFLREKDGLVPCRMLSFNGYVIVKGVYSNLYLRSDKKYVEIINRVL